MLTWLKQVIFSNKRGQNKILYFPVPRAYSSEKRYVIESLKLKGYLLIEDYELTNHLVVDLFLKKENMAIIFLGDAACPIERTYMVKTRTAVHEQGLQCFIFERRHFYKSLNRLHFRLRQQEVFEEFPPGIH